MFRSLTLDYQPVRNGDEHVSEERFEKYERVMVAFFEEESNNMRKTLRNFTVTRTRSIGSRTANQT